jgi:hypothetical protein
MRFVANLKSGLAVHKVDLDLSHVEMTQNQTIDVDANDPCESGKCLASSLLPADEFAKIRGLKGKLGGHLSPEWIIIDFCIHAIRHKN